MNLKTVLIVLISLFYVFGICAQLYDCVEVYAALCTFSIIIIIFSNVIRPKYSILIFLAFCLGFYNTDFQVKDYDSIYNERLNDIVAQGTVRSILQISKEGTRAKFYFNINKINFKGKNYSLNNTTTLVVINDMEKRFNKIQIGDTISICGNIRPPKSATNPSQFDYAKYLKYKDTFSILYSEDENFKVLKKADKYANPEEFYLYLAQKTDTIRNKITNVHAKYIKSPQLEILGGIVFGNEAINPPDEIKQSFINSGLLHLLAASGLNVALIFGIWWFLAQNILKLPYIISIWLGAFFIILYTFTTGFPPPVLRASIMLLFVLFGKLIDREVKPIALIFFVGFIMLIFNPKMFCDVGFQLSFIVTIGLMITIEPICEKLNNKNKEYIYKIKHFPKFIKIILMSFSPKFLLAAFLVPLCAQLYVAPLQMYYFNTFTPWSLIANLCVIPFIGAVSFLGFISSIFSTIPYLQDKVIFIFDIIINPFLVLLVKISQFFSTLKYSIITTPSPNVFQIILFWSILILFVQNIKENFKNKNIFILFCTIILIFFATFIKIPSKNFEIIIFDVGNADSALIKTPNNKYIMIDTAMAPYRGVSNAKTIIEEYLKDKNIKEIELLIITHFDADHCGGAKDILNDLKVRTVYLQNINPHQSKGIEIINILKNKHIKYYAAKNNEIIYKEKNFSIKTLSAKIPGDTDKTDNENSIVTLINSNSTSALFMGDAGVLGYNKYKDKIGKIDIFKIGHHGATNSVNKEMLNNLNPRYTIISTGYNIYGHPSADTIEYLKATDTKTYTTKDLGAIKISNCKKGLCEIKNYKTKIKDFVPLD